MLGFPSRRLAMSDPTKSPAPSPTLEPESARTSPTMSRRDVLATSAAVGAASLFPAQIVAAAEGSAIRPFHYRATDAELADLRRRVAATRFPERETVSDASQGVQLATIQALTRAWAGDYDWRRCEAALNALPQFITEIDGVDIHFIHVRSR